MHPFLPHCHSCSGGSGVWTKSCFFCCRHTLLQLLGCFMFIIIGFCDLFDFVLKGQLPQLLQVVFLQDSFLDCTFFQRFPFCRGWLPLCRGVLPFGKGLIPLPRGLLPLCRGWFHCLFYSLHWLPHCCKNKRAAQKEFWYQNGCNAIWFWVHVFGLCLIFNVFFFHGHVVTRKNSSDEIWWNLMKSGEIWWKFGLVVFFVFFIRFHQISSDFIRKYGLVVFFVFFLIGWNCCLKIVLQPFCKGLKTWPSWRNQHRIIGYVPKTVAQLIK